MGESRPGLVKWVNSNFTTTFLLVTQRRALNPVTCDTTHIKRWWKLQWMGKRSRRARFWWVSLRLACGEYRWPGEVTLEYLDSFIFKNKPISLLFFWAELTLVAYWCMRQTYQGSDMWPTTRSPVKENVRMQEGVRGRKERMKADQKWYIYHFFLKS